MPTIGKSVAFALGAALLAIPAASQAGTIVQTQTIALGSRLNFLDAFTFTPPHSGTLKVEVSSLQTGVHTNVNFATNGVKLNGTNLTVVSSGISELRSIFIAAVSPVAQALSVKGSSQALGSYTVTYTYTGVVPEPTTWALMIAGFGAVGYAMRRRRKADGATGGLALA